ncbi:hypothetical protein [Desulfogranum mediterraneum]|uniref:hypothetical protein n=1 Tax=Desulfogranum mediterraneum TaxID=160661 RepID=UPI000405CEA8|nr:hypothetical protein [Desulfogranum mediterraneum]
MNAEQARYKISHFFLVLAENPSQATEQVAHYLKGNQLISYADLVIRAEEIIAAREARFWPTVERAVAKNMEFGRSMVDILHQEGVETLGDLLEMEQGYLTKALHTLTHLLDGFIGVDSVFYSLVEDSHRVSKRLEQAVLEDPDRYWLIPVRTGMLEASVLHL